MYKGGLCTRRGVEPEVVEIPLHLPEEEPLKYSAIVKEPETPEFRVVFLVQDVPLEPESGLDKWMEEVR